MNGLEERLGQRIGTVEATQADQTSQISDLLTRVQKLEASPGAANRSSSVPAQLEIGHSLEIPVGGFPLLSRKAIEHRVNVFVGEAQGLDTDKPFTAGGNASTIAFVRFVSTEHRDTFVAANLQRAEQMGLRVKKNRSAEERARASIAWKVYDQLEKAGISRGSATISRSIIYKIGNDDGSAAEIGKVNGERVAWNDKAPATLRNTE